jgi:TonB family protein
MRAKYIGALGILLFSGAMALAQTPPTNPPLSMPTLERPAKVFNNPGSWINADDYPAFAIKNKLTGVVRVELAVAENGRVSACTILESSGAYILDSLTCNLMLRRARFTPALDAAGKPAVGTFVQRVMWRHPKVAVDPILLSAPNPDSDPATWVTAADYPPIKPVGGGAAPTAPALAALYFGLDVSASGKIMGCKNIKNKASSAKPSGKAVKTICALLQKRARISPAQNYLNRPMAWRYVATVQWPV